MASKSTETTVQSKRKSSAEILRERKVSAYLEQISQHEEMMNLMKAERDALSGASILGIPVSHRRFG